MKMSKPKKLAWVLVAWTVCVLLVLNIISAVIIGITAGSAMTKKEQDYFKSIANSAKIQVEGFVENYLNVSKTITQNEQIINAMQIANKTNGLNANPNVSEILGTIKRVEQSDENILNIAIGSTQEQQLYLGDGTPHNLDLTNENYAKAVSTKTTVITQPYIDTVTGSTTVSIIDPILSNGTVVGLVALDLRLSGLSEFLRELSFGETGRVLLVSQNNVIIGYENTEFVGKPLESLGMTGPLIKEFENSTGKFANYDINGVHKIGRIIHLENTGWKLLVGLAQKEFNYDIISMLTTLGIVLLITTLIVAIIVNLIIAKKLRPIQQINNGLKQMSEGNLNVVITHDGEDEIGQMANSMRACVETLALYVNEIDTTMKALATGDLTAKSSVQFKGDFQPIQDSITAFVKKLTELMSSIYQASEQVTAGSEQVSSGAQALAQGATEQASSIQELAAAVTEISETVKTNVQTANEASEGAVKVNRDITESGQKMQQSLAYMNEIRNSSNEISKIIKTIEDIAFQTNILALNAAVEAARAGSAGKGFAVVADEVRNLAAKSAEASQTTTALIEASLAAVDKGTLSVEETAQFMENVVEEAQKITDVFQSIAHASEEQSTSITQVTLGIDQVSSVVQTNSATAEQSAAASEELSGQAQMLKRMINQFKMDNVDDGSMMSAYTSPVSDYRNSDYGMNDYGTDKY